MIDQSGGLEHRLRVMEQTLQVVQKEVNDVLGELQTVLQGITRGNKMAFDVFHVRISELEGKVNSLEATLRGMNSPVVASEGKEL